MSRSKGSLLEAFVRKKHFSEKKLWIRGVTEKARHVSEAYWFNGLVISCIFADSLLVGIEVDGMTGDALEERFVFWLSDCIIAAIFLAETVARLHAHGWEYFQDPWNIFDYICVTLGLTALAQPLQSGAAQSNSVNIRMMKTFKGFRVLRLLRVVRHIGGLKIVQGLWLLTTSLLNGSRTLFWVLVLSSIALYTLSVMMLTIVMDEEKLMLNWSEVDIYLGGMLNTMLTIWQVSTLDSWASSVATPIITEAPLAGVVVFFSIFMITFGIFNVVLAVMVELIRDAMEFNQTKTNARLEETDNAIMDAMSKEFKNCDVDSSGTLDREEFMKMICRKDFAFKLHLIGIHNAEAAELFNIMDADKSGCVSPDEFVEGIRKIRGPATGHDLVKIICLAQKQCGRARKFVEKVQGMSERADILQDRLNSMGMAMTEELSMRNEAGRRKNVVEQQGRMTKETLRTMQYRQITHFPSVRDHSAPPELYSP